MRWDRFKPLIEEALVAFNLDPRYIVDMANGGTLIQNRKLSKLQSSEDAQRAVSVA